jgi:FkbM family methyltransferase
MDTTKTNLLKLLEEQAALQKEFEENYTGPGLLKKFKRLFRYRSKYLRYCFSRFKPHLVKIKTFWGEDILVFFPEHFIFSYIGFPPESEPEIKLTKFFIKNLKEDSVFYDVGANCGYYSLLTKEIIKTGEVHAFEPVPKTFKILKENLSKKQRVFLNQLALFNKEGEIDFYDGSGVGCSGGSTFDIFKRTELLNFKKIKIKTTTIDKYCFNHLKPTFLKIDVEGAESQVIEGGIKTLKETDPIIAMEVWRKSPDNNSHLKAIEILYGLDYKSYKINNEGELEFIEKIDPNRDILGKNMSDNFVFLKS